MDKIYVVVMRCRRFKLPAKTTGAKSIGGNRLVGPADSHASRAATGGL